VILLLAPAGYGKSRTLAQWAQRDRRQFAWLDAGRSGNDPACLARMLGGALERLAGMSSPGARRRQSPPGTPMLAALVALADKVSAQGPAVLVLDDVHRLASRRALELLAGFIGETSQSLRVALASRSEPVIGLGRLRAAGDLQSLDPFDLSMNAGEAQALLRAMGIELDEEEMLQVLQRSEGWPAGIRLMAEALSAQHEGRGVAPLGITHHGVAQYIREEVLQPLAPDARALLVRTSILDHLSGSLCDAVAGTRGSGETLRQLAAGGSMLVPLDPARSWFRCHTMLREVLRAELEGSDASDIRLLHKRASSWFQHAGDIDMTLEHAFAARDTEAAATLLWDHASRYLYGSDTLVLAWLSQVTPEEIGACPGLAIAAAHSYLAVGDAGSARHWARVGAESLTGRPGARLDTLASSAKLIELATGSCASAEADAAARLLADSPAALPLRPLALLVEGVALTLRGKRHAARAPLLGAVEASSHAMPWVAVLALTELALGDVAEGAWERASVSVEDSLSRLRSNGLDMLPPAALTHSVAALVMSHGGIADGAKQEMLSAARQLERLMGKHTTWYEVQARVVLARACTRLADVGRARSLLAQASRRARGANSVPLFASWLDDAWGEVDDVAAASLNGPGSLTMAELRVLRFLPSHLSFREIGERLHVSPNTVKSQAHAIYAKLGASSRSEAVAHGAALGLVDAMIL
jgi:LuxR family maltose regulon positive regulatory protein